MRVVTTLLCSAALLVRSATADACGETDEPYYVFKDQQPTGAGVPRNAPLVVELAEQAGGPAEPRLDPRLTLTAKGSDEAIELKSLGSAPRLSWIPDGPLAPLATYEARFNSGYEGEPDTIWEFTTGDELTAPVALDGALQVTFEDGTEPVLECLNNCGTDCVQTGTTAVTRARIRVPRARHGFPNYHAEVWLTDDSPYEFSSAGTDAQGAHRVSLGTWVSYDERGEPLEDAVLTVPVEDAPYRPCFAFRIVDQRDDRAVGAPFCAEETIPLAAPTEDSEASPSSSGCAFGVSRSSSSSVVALIVAASAVIARRRRQLSG